MNLWHTLPVLLLLAGAALVARWVLVGWLYERKPRVWRAEWSSVDGPSQVEVGQAIRRAQERGER